MVTVDIPRKTSEQLKLREKRLAQVGLALGLVFTAATPLCAFIGLANCRNFNESNVPYIEPYIAEGVGLLIGGTLVCLAASAVSMCFAIKHAKRAGIL